MLIVLVGDDALVVGLGVVGFGFNGREILVEGGVIFFDDEVGFSDEGRVVFEVDEAVRTVEGKVEFLAI